jgi:hypothetical protein
LLVCAALLAALCLAGSHAEAQTPAQAASPPKPTAPTAAATSPTEVLRLINQERARARLRPLRLHAKLSSASRRLADNMARQNRFVWTVGGKNTAQLLREAGYTPALYKDFGWDGGTAKDLVNYLVRNQTALIRSARYTDLGIAVARGARGVSWFTLVFAAPSQAEPKAPPPPSSGTPISSTTPTTPDLNAKVLAFAQAQLGTMKQIGDGQCTGLVIAALQAAGAKTTYDYGISGGDSVDYRWGNLVLTARPGISLAGFAQVRPGDVLQFRSVRYSGNPYTTEHHSALVSANLGGGRFRVIEQNSNNHHYAEEHEINLAAMTQGTVWIYRPVKK